MNILVVGGAGYIGSHALSWLAKAGHEVWAYDNLVAGHKAAVPTGRLIEGDLHEVDKLADAMRSLHIEGVMHFAAYAAVGESVVEPAKYYRNNLAGSLALLEAMRSANVGKMVFSSTAATYGEPEEMPISEDTPQRPVNPYGFTKLAVERALFDYARAYGLGFAALRYFNAAGAAGAGDLGEDHTPETHLIPLVLQVALGQRERISIFGDDYPTPDGTCVRDYVHVDDLADAHLRALEVVRAGEGICLNLGTGRGFSVREVVETCRRVSGRPIPEIVSPRRPGDPPVLVADARRAREALDWQPKYLDVESIVSTAWKWHSSHPRGYVA